MPMFVNWYYQSDSLELNVVQLFFLDSTPSAANVPDFSLQSNLHHDKTSPDHDNDAAWVDSDDERNVISLASNLRLRKLRTTESEDLVNGKEYSKRLRCQFERLHPVPDWASASIAKKAVSRKRRKLSNASESSETNILTDDMSVGSDDLSTQPLVKLLQNTDSLTQLTSTSSATREKLRPEIIDICRTKDVGAAQPASLPLRLLFFCFFVVANRAQFQSSITNLVFHPVHSLLLSSGPSSTIFLHHVSPQSTKPNPLLTTLHLNSTPLTTSLFQLPAGNKIFFSGRRRYFHVWDLDTGRIEKISRVIGHGELQRSMECFKLSPCGRWIGLVGSGRKGGGTINIIDANTCQWIAELRVEGKGGVVDFDWWENGEGLVAASKGGEVVEWDGRKRRIVARWIDEGAVGITSVALGGDGGGPKSLGNDRWVALGNSSGIVNIYDRRKWIAESVPFQPRPVRAFGQLTTPASLLKFSPDGQLLCMASRWKRDALRLIHLPTCTVYRNWPTSSTPLGRITAVAWSPNSEMIAVANEQGKIRLWVIRI